MECPTCGDRFDTSRGMKVHHYREHGEKIGGEKVSCEYCGEFLRKKPNRASGNNFCSHDCHGKWLSENVVGENHPLYGKIDVECYNCGEKLKRKKHREGKKHFCNQKCQGEWRSRNMSGEDSWAYKDGSSLENYYNTPEWKRFRRKMVEKIETECAICEDNSGRQNSLHHIIRMGDFNDRRNANVEENVVFLCQSHHMELENKGVGEQMEKLNTVRHLPNSVEELRDVIDDQNS